MRSCSWSTGEFGRRLAFTHRAGRTDSSTCSNVISGVAGYNADANSLVSYARNAAQVRLTFALQMRARH